MALGRFRTGVITAVGLGAGLLLMQLLLESRTTSPQHPSLPSSPPPQLLHYSPSGEGGGLMDRRLRGLEEKVEQIASAVGALRQQPESVRKEDGGAPLGVKELQEQMGQVAATVKASGLTKGRGFITRRSIHG
jgi:hypothetical protein